MSVELYQAMARQDSEMDHHLKRPVALWKCQASRMQLFPPAGASIAPTSNMCTARSCRSESEVRLQPKALDVSGKPIAETIDIMLRHQTITKNPRRPIGGQPKRFLLWEIHPIEEVCFARAPTMPVTMAAYLS